MEKYFLLLLLITTGLISCSKNRSDNPEKNPLKLKFEQVGKVNFISDSSKYKNETVHCIGRFRDDLGVHYIKVSTNYSLPHLDSKKQTETRELSVRMYDSLLYDKKQIQEYHDQILECPFSTELYPIKKSILLTDLDHDRIAEFWLAYYKSCSRGAGEHTPKDIIVVLLKRNKQYILHGKTTVIAYEELNPENSYQLSENFANLDDSFSRQAIAIWENYKTGDYK